MASRRSAVGQSRTEGLKQTFQAAIISQQRGELEQAERLFEAVLESDPDHFGALCSTASLHLRRGSAASGLALMERALARSRDSAQAFHLYADLLRASGRPAEAAAQYEQAITLKPDFAEAYSNLAGLQSDQGRYEAARTLYEKSLVIRPDFAEAYNNLAVVLLALGRPKDALLHSDRALTIKPDFAEAEGNRGNALVALGRVADAALAFESAIRLSPRTGRFYLDLVGCRSLGTDDPAFQAMQALARDPSGLSAEDRIYFQFALGKALAGAGRFPEAFGCFRQANALKRVHTDYDEAQTLAIMDRMRAVFTPDRLRGRPGAGASSSTPIFVVGMPRSGTTLVEQILASHPDVFGAGERYELHRTVSSLAGGGGDLSSILAYLPSLPEERLRWLGEDYLLAMRTVAPQAQRIVDKMPGNFLYVGLIRLILPNAKIIHVHRDPLDTCVSCFTTLFGGQQPYTYNLSELGRYYRAYAALMRHWRTMMPSDGMLDIRYEDVVTDLEGQARAMVAYCALEWNESCLAFHATQRTVQTASKAQVRQPLYRSSVGRWKAYEGMLEPLIQALGPDASAKA